MPHVLNPEEGFIVSANHPVVPQNANDKWFFGHSFSQAYRAQRLYKVVESKNPITIQDCIDLQMDVTSIAAIEFVSRVKAMNLNSSDPDIALALQLLRVSKSIQNVISM
jgi:acyl-homoserine lactone acylase PvdQ